MARFSSWWRNGAGALVACFMAVFAMLPAFDAVICETDEPAAAHATAAYEGVDQDHPGHTEPSGVCPHGHCHQAVSEAPERAAFGAITTIVAQAFGLSSSSVPVTNPQFRLIRPPRA